MTEHNGELIMRHDGVEYYRFTYQAGILYEYPRRSLGISNEEQREQNL